MPTLTGRNEKRMVHLYIDLCLDHSARRGDPDVIRWGCSKGAEKTFRLAVDSSERGRVKTLYRKSGAECALVDARQKCSGRSVRLDSIVGVPVTWSTAI